MNRLVIVGALGAVFVAASGASAKGPGEAVVCGRSLSVPEERACLHLDQRDEIAAWLIGSISEPFHMRSRPRPAPFYTVEIRSRDHRGWNWSFVYVPSRRVIRHTTPLGMIYPRTRSVYWRTVPTDVTRAFETLSKRLRPFPAPRRWR